MFDKDASLGCLSMSDVLIVWPIVFESTEVGKID